MAFVVRELRGQRFVEGVPGQPLIGRADAVTEVIELCFEHAARGLLLFSDNLPERFFDLSSGEAGAILQKLRTYRIRLAVVRRPGLRLSSRFDQLLVDEHQGSAFHLFDERDAAEAWLCPEDGAGA